MDYKSQESNEITYYKYEHDEGVKYLIKPDIWMLSALLYSSTGQVSKLLKVIDKKYGTDCKISMTNKQLAFNSEEKAKEAVNYLNSLIMVNKLKGVN